MEEEEWIEYYRRRRELGVYPEWIPSSPEEVLPPEVEELPEGLPSRKIVEFLRQLIICNKLDVLLVRTLKGSFNLWKLLELLRTLSFDSRVKRSIGIAKSLTSSFSVATGAGKNVIITNNVSEDLTDYSILIELTSENFDDWDKVSEDGSDIYFTDLSGNPLYYWIEEFDKAGQHALIWVKIPLIPANESVTIKLMYGQTNPYTDYRSGDNTFLFFDDFLSDLSKWSGDTTYFSISNSILTTTASERAIYSKVDVTGDIAIESKVKINSGGRAHIAGRLQPPYGFRDLCYILNFRYPNSDIRLYRGGSPVIILDTAPYNHSEVWRRARLFLIGNGADNIQKADFDGSKVLQGSDTSIGNTGRVRLGSNVLATGGQVWWDWIFARKYVEPEPTVSILS